MLRWRCREEMMARQVLLILAPTAQAKLVRRLLADSGLVHLELESVHRCRDAIERLAGAEGGDIVAVLVDLFPPDSQGIDTFDRLFRASPHIPILVLSRLRDEDIARLALRRGAQEYLLEERLDSDKLSMALISMLERSVHAQTLLLERERAQVTLDSIGDAVITIDISGTIAYINPAAARMTGW